MARWFVLVISIAWYGSMSSFTTEELNAGSMSTTLRNNYFHYVAGTNMLDKISPTAGGSVTSPFASNNRSFTYDKNGNVIADNLRDQTMSYDRANLPFKSVKANGSTQVFGYNTADARIFKGNDNQAYYYLAGSVYDMKNDEWEHYPGGLAVHKNNSLNLIIKDHLTNTRAIVRDGTDACPGSMTYQTQYDYYPYGKVLRKLENPRSRFQSTDHETDEETGYNNRNARWYDDESFQFLGCDPLGDKYPSLSLYNYVARNPISLTDPSGKWIPGYSENGLHLTAEQGDSRASLIDFWGSEDNARTFMKDFDKLDFENLHPDDIFSVDHNAINSAIQHSFKNPERYMDFELSLKWRGLISGNMSQSEQNRFYSQARDDSKSTYNCHYFAIMGVKNKVMSDYYYESTEYDECADLSPIEGGKIIRSNFYSISPVKATPLKTIMTFGDAHYAIYFGKSRNGNQFVVHKDGLSMAPRVEQLNNLSSSNYSYGNIRTGTTTPNWSNGWYTIKE